MGLRTSEQRRAIVAAIHSHYLKHLANSFNKLSLNVTFSVNNSHVHNGDRVYTWNG